MATKRISAQLQAQIKKMAALQLGHFCNKLSPSAVDSANSWCRNTRRKEYGIIHYCRQARTIPMETVMADIERYNSEILKNLTSWTNKPLLRKIYKSFHELIANQLRECLHGHVVELGSGIADIREVIPGCIRTDLCQNPWIDQTENVYNLSFKDKTVSGVILFDVFHHLRYPGTALKEIHRVLQPGGRVVLFEPCVSLLGRFVYGVLHQEPLALKREIAIYAPEGWVPDNIDYYAAQGNAHRLFLKREIDIVSTEWHILTIKRLSAISYVLSGGYSKPQLYPSIAFPLVQLIDTLCDRFPDVFATRMLVVLEKPSESGGVPANRQEHQ